MSDVRERPILFSGPLVRAILEGRKTQTRRVVKGTPPDRMCERCWRDAWDGGHYGGRETQAERYAELLDERASLPCWALPCPYGQAGDRLWVRETWGVGSRPCPMKGWREGIEYRADEAYLEDDRDLLPLYEVEPPDGVTLDELDGGRWRPSIHMFRWASRITLDVVDVRVERLQQITEEDARAEGCPFTHDGKPYDPPLNDPWQGYGRASFCLLWQKVNGKREGCSWDDNPWVWVVTFRRVQP